MKKIFIFFGVVILLIFASDKIYKIYSSNYINDHESIILINNHLSEKDVDAFFNLSAGTYDSKKHRIIYSLLKKDVNLLDAYINLPVKYSNDQFNCDIVYSEAKPYGFYDYEIGSSSVIARVISADANANRLLNSEQVISEKQLGARYRFGKINVLDVNKSGIIEHCK